MNKKVNIKYAIINSLYQILCAVFYAFGIFVLLEKGFEASIAGLCLAFACIFAFIVQPILSNVLDNLAKKYLFYTLLVFSIGSAVCLSLLMFIKSSTALMILTFVLAGGLFATLEPFVNSISACFSQNGVAINYPRSRAFGALAYAVFSYLFGIFSVSYSYYGVLISAIIVSILLGIVSFSMNEDYQEIEAVSVEKEDSVSFGLFFKNNKAYMLLCVFLTLSFFCYTCIDNYMVLIVESVGGSSADLGSIQAIKALLEMLIIFSIPFLLKKIKIHNLLSFSVWMIAAKALVILLAKSVLHLYIAQIFQMLSFGILLTGMVEFVNQTMSAREAIRGHAFFTMTLVLGSILASLFGGFIIDSFSVTVFEIIALGFGIIASVGFMFTIKKF